MTEDPATVPNRHSMPSMDKLLAFIREVESDLAELPTEERVRSVGIRPDRFDPSQWKTQVHLQIARIAESDQRGIRSHVMRLESELVLAHLFDDVALEPLFGALSAMMSIQAPDRNSKPGGNVDWRALARASHVYSLLGGWSECSPFMFPREHSLVAAAKRLRDRGYVVERSGATFDLSEIETNRLIDRLQELIAAMGGLLVAKRIFEQLAKRLDPQLERYHFNRLSGPVFPAGYILALAAKQVREPPQSADTIATWTELQELATDYATLFDVQEYLPPFLSDTTRQTFPEMIARLALYDALYTVPQITPRYVTRILRPLLSAVSSTVECGSGCNLDAFLAVIERIYVRVGPRRGPVRIEVSELAHDVPGVSPGVVRAIVLDRLTHPTEGPNLSYLRPTDLTVRGMDPLKGPGNSLYFRPLLRLGQDDVVLLDRSVAGPAFVEAVLAAFREHVGKGFQDRVIGPGLENLLHTELRAHGIAAKSGMYQVPGATGECDIVVESRKRFAFIECKAKPLVRDASAGSDVAAIESLAGSLIAAHVQALGHEVRLRKYGRLDLRNGHTSGIVEWTDQEIDRVALALFDFGAFQDRTTVMHLLSNCVRYQFGVGDNSESETSSQALYKLNESLDMLRVHLTEWFSLVKDRNPFHPCWFLSAQQLLMILEGVGSPDDFFERLGHVRSISFQTLDLPSEFKLAMKLREGRSHGL